MRFAFTVKRRYQPVTAVKNFEVNQPLGTYAEAVFSMLSLTVLANVNLLKGGESPMGWRPGDLLPKRLRFRRGDWKVGAEFGGEGEARVNVLSARSGGGGDAS